MIQYREDQHRHWAVRCPLKLDIRHCLIPKCLQNKSIYDDSCLEGPVQGLRAGEQEANSIGRECNFLQLSDNH